MIRFWFLDLFLSKQLILGENYTLFGDCSRFIYLYVDGYILGNNLTILTIY